MGDEQGQASTKGPRFVATKRHRHAAAAALDSRPRAQVCVVDAKLCQAPTDRDDQAPDLTGFYQEKTSDRPHYTMQINQAGDHVHVWVRQVLDSRYAKQEAHERRWTYYGRRPNGASTFRLFVKPENWDCDDGELSGTPSSLTFKGSGITGPERPALHFERCAGKAARRPVYSERVRLLMESEGSDDARKLLDAEYYRLSQYDIARIRRAAHSDELKRLLDAFLDQPNHSPAEWNAWQRCIVDLDNYVAHALFRRQRRALDDFGIRAGPPEASEASWHEGDLEAVYREVWLALRFQKYVRGKEGGSMLGWLSRALHQRVEKLAAPYGQAQDFVAIKQLLRLGEPGGGEGLRVYKYKFRFVGGEGGAKFVLGIKIRAGAVEVSRDGAILGMFDFAMLVGATGLAAGGGLGNYKAEVVVEARDRWDAQDFPGALEFLEAGGEATFAGTGGEGKVGVIVLHGSGRHPPLNLDLTGTDKKLPVPTDPLDWAHDPKPPKIPDLKGEVGVSASLGAGYLWGEGLEPTKHVRRDADQAPEEVTFVKALSERQKVHFFEGDSRLTPWGKQVLGMFCADELRCLLDEHCSLAVDGFTDPKGSEESNKDLSKWRAQNALQAVMEIVGDGRLKARLGVPEGHGEGPARRELPDRTDDPHWRKVSVTLDSNVLLRLHAPRR
jgi:outer membrane protein OmpA-like peptidoglycan-associated protein